MSENHKPCLNSSEPASSVKPITPDEVVGAKAETIPSRVIQVWNRLIADNWSNGRAHIMQSKAVDAILSDHNDPERTPITRGMVFHNGWLDIEDVYRAAGWVVEYDKPGYNEDYEASFTFKRAR